MAQFNVTSTVKLNIPKINHLNVSAVKALEMVTALLLSQIKNAEVMPFDTGNLQNESTFTDHSDSNRGITRIISNTVYARRLYYHPEYNFNREYNIAAGGKWLEPWLPGGSQEDFVIKAFARLYRKENDL